MNFSYTVGIGFVSALIVLGVYFLISGVVLGPINFLFVWACACLGARIGQKLF